MLLFSLCPHDKSVQRCGADQLNQFLHRCRPIGKGRTEYCKMRQIDYPQAGGCHNALSLSCLCFDCSPVRSWIIFDRRYRPRATDHQCNHLAYRAGDWIARRFEPPPGSKAPEPFEAFAGDHLHINPAIAKWPPAVDIHPAAAAGSGKGFGCSDERTAQTLIGIAPAP